MYQDPINRVTVMLAMVSLLLVAIAFTSLYTFKSAAMIQCEVKHTYEKCLYHLVD
jgi:hypothetical protein